MEDLYSTNSSHNASESMAGYLFQARYALLRGLEEVRHNPSHALSIERFDDVAFEDEGQPIEVIQTKHHSNPGDTSDNSVDLWKTLNIWLQQIVGDPVTVSDTRFVLITTNTAAEGSALSKLRQTNGQRDISGAIDLLTNAAQTSHNRATQVVRAAFLDLKPALKKLLVQNMWVIDHAPGIIDVREEIEAMLHFSAPPDQIDTFTDYLEGWWFNRVVLSLTNPNSASIPLVAIQNKVSELRESFQRDKLPLDDAIATMTPPTTLPEDGRMFVRQMKLIDITEHEMLAMVNDYYRAFEQRSRWARESLLLDGEVARYDDNLWDAWNRRFIANVADIDDNSNDNIKLDQGKKTFRWACQYQKPLRNRDEIWLSSGSFQMLADIVRIGWHPDYEVLLTSNEGDA